MSWGYWSLCVSNLVSKETESTRNLLTIEQHNNNNNDNNNNNNLFLLGSVLLDLVLNLSSFVPSLVFLFPDLAAVRDRNIEDLSGGELQRFACAVVCIQRADM